MKMSDSDEEEEENPLEIKRINKNPHDNDKDYEWTADDIGPNSCLCTICCRIICWELVNYKGMRNIWGMFGVVFFMWVMCYFLVL